MASRTFIALILFAGLSTALASAQGLPDVAIGLGPGMPPMGGKGIATMHLEILDIEPAKGAPFCATVTTDHTQTFADGNRIHTSENSPFCRDSEGRTRREATLNMLGAAPEASSPKLITIVDPVAGFRYMLDSQNKIAHRASIGQIAGGMTMKAGPGGSPEKGQQVMFYRHVGPAGPSMVLNDNLFFKKAGQVSDGPAPATESLGDQTIDGVHATGTRITTTIPAGKMGNEQPILVTSERWYSPELKATVLTKHQDPWAGELKTQLTNVNTSEPDVSLFSVPSDYKVVDEKAGPFVIQKRSLGNGPGE